MLNLKDFSSPFSVYSTPIISCLTNSAFLMQKDCSNPHATSNAIFRRHLNGRAWMNDPDVFFLREENMKMTFEKRKLIAKINSTFGSLLFISDNIKNYNDAQKAVLKETFAPKDICIKKAEFVKQDIIGVEYTENGETSLRSLPVTP